MKPLPLRFRMLNALGGALQKMGLQIAPLRIDRLQQKAIKQSGLSDFGDPRYEEGLRVLVQSAEEDANLHTLGRLIYKNMIIDKLVNRLKWVDAQKSKPEWFTEPIIPPLIVTGLPRSGTTLLHRLLALDPSHRAIPAWEMTHPFPSESKEARRIKAVKELAFLQKLAPELDRKHEIRADKPEECLFLMASTFTSFYFWGLAPVYGYMEWYMTQDMAPKYHQYKGYLHILQNVDPTKRLTLKAPIHRHAIHTLYQTIPNAMIIQTHRDPVRVVNSMNSLISSLHRMVCTQDIPRMARMTLEIQSKFTLQNLEQRQKMPDVIFDIYYPELVANPIQTVRNIYDHFALPWPDGHHKRLQSYMKENKQGKYGTHSYSSEKFGLTDDEIRRQFTDYLHAFGKHL